MKACSKCEVEKEDSDFGIRKCTGKPRSRCRKCEAAIVAEIKHRKAFGLPSLKEIRKKIHGRFTKGTVEYRVSTSLKYNYGITLEDYNRMLDSQSGLCAICGKPQTTKRLDVDHNHTTHKVRELLCNHCNKGLGHFFESTDLLIKASQYLEKHNKLK